MSHQPTHIYEFGSFRLDVAERLLQRDGKNVLLQPKVFALLLVLVEHHGHLLEKDELMKLVWPDVIVEEANLSNNISILRRTLGENGSQFIETVPKHGYRFVAAVRETGAEQARHTVQEATVSRRRVIASPRRLLMASIVVVSLALCLYYFWSGRSAAPVTINSLAVLPFKPLVMESHNEVLELGMADSLISKLSTLKQISVRPLSAVRKYTSLEQDPVAAGREQQVDAVLESSLQWVGENVRVTVRLLNVQTGQQLWADRCDEQCSPDIFKMQDNIAEKITHALALHLTGEEKKLLAKHYTENREAFQLYQTGRYFWNKRTEEAMKKAFRYFQQAIDKDPTYALAYAGMAEDYQSFAGLSYGSPQEYYPAAKEYAMKALALDEMLAEGHSVLATVKINYDLDWAGSEREYKHAIALNSEYATVHQRYARFLSAMGRVEEGLAEIRQALELDPTSLMINQDIGEQFYYAGRYEEAIKELRKTLEMDPNYYQALLTLGSVYLQKKMYAEAMTELNQALAISRDNTLGLLGYAYAVSGRKREARAVLEELQTLSRRHYIAPVDVAAIYAGLNEPEPSFAWLKKACEERGYKVSYLKVDPRFDNLRHDPRFTNLLRRISLAP